MKLFKLTWVALLWGAFVVVGCGEAERSVQSGAVAPDDETGFRMCSNAAFDELKSCRQSCDMEYWPAGIGSPWWEGCHDHCTDQHREAWDDCVTDWHQDDTGIRIAQSSTEVYDSWELAVQDINADMASTCWSMPDGLGNLDGHGRLRACAQAAMYCFDCAESYACDPCAGQPCADAECTTCPEPVETPSCFNETASCARNIQACNEITLEWWEPIDVFEIP